MTVTGGKVRVIGYQVEVPAKVVDNFAIFESFKTSNEIDLMNSSSLIMNVTSQLYITVIPDSFGAIMTLEY